MLKKVQSALLLTTSKSFSEVYTTVAEEMYIDLHIESEWRDTYFVSEEVVICGAKYLKDISKEYYKRLVLILKKDESIGQYIEMGIERFIFDFENRAELVCSFLFPQKEVFYSYSRNLMEIVQSSFVTTFVAGDYNFDFLKGRYFYKNQELYLTNAQKTYLAEWLLKHNKDNKRRNILTTLKKSFGKDFLKDVDRYGTFISREVENV